MKSLLRMSDEELAGVETESGFAVGPSIGLAVTSSVLAMAGMMLRYAPGDAVPLSGMDTIAGQCFWGGALGLIMLTGAYVVRSLFMKRLQWAVLASLAIHLLICGALNVVKVDVPMALVAEAGDADRPPRDITMPDYGGAESRSEQQQWERPTEVDVAQSNQQQLERQQSEIEVDSEIAPVERPQRVAEASVPERQQREQARLEEARQLEIKRQQQNAEADAPEQMEVPEVQTADSEQPDVEARELERSESQLQEAKRRMDQRVIQQQQPLAAANLSRSEVMPENDLRADVERQQREAAEARVAEAMANAVDVAAVDDAPRMNAQERAVEAARQSQPDLTSNSRADNPNPLTSPQMQVSSAASLSRAQNQATADASPSSGVSGAMQRSASASGQKTSAADASAQAVAVASVAGASAPNLTASTAASAVARGSSANPTGASSGGGSPAMSANPFGVSSVQSGTVGRSQGSQTGPQMGDAVANAPSSGGRQRSATPGAVASGAVGTRAADVSVGGAAAGNDAAGQVLASGPASASSNVARNGQGLPATRGNTGNTPGVTSGGQGTEMTIAMNATGNGGLSGRATEPSARLSGAPATGRIGGASGRSSTGRRSAAAALPKGMLQAERSGALVEAGPQAAPRGSSGSGRLSGPRVGSLPRQSAGLPGAGRGSVSVARRRTGLPGGLSSTRLPSRANTGAGRPKLATAGEVAAMINRTVPGISPVQSERISAGFSMRAPEARNEAVGKLGGSDASEAAVDRALEWLAAHQYAAGNWSIHNPNCTDHTCTGPGTYEADPAATGLSLLAFLGAGHTHRTGDYQQEVQRGLDWLLQNQADDGDLFAYEAEFARFYSHGIAAIALCEAYGMTKDRKLKGPAQNAINFIAASQHPDFGGWRYEAQFESDTSVSGWQLMALKSGEMAGLDIPRSTYAGVTKWLDTVEDEESPGRFRYHPTKDVTDSMTAEGLLMRQYLGAGREDSDLQAGASHLKSRLPRRDGRDVYYWYYATQVMFHMQGEHWDEWNAALRDMLVETQDKAGTARGSWDPALPTKDTWGQSGGRHYVTCLNVLMLEVYYRHLPLYIELNR